MRKLRIDELGRMSAEAYREAEKFPLVVILDNVRSMRNVGSFFRTCDAFRVEKIYLCGISPRPPHREITKTALGAETVMDWEYAEDAAALAAKLRADGLQLVAVEQTDSSEPVQHFVVDTTQRYALIFGHEVDGVSEALIAQCDHAVEIPQYGTKHSLNVSVAGGIVLFQFAIAFDN